MGFNSAFKGLIVDWDGLPGCYDVYCFMDVAYVRNVEICM